MATPKKVIKKKEPWIKKNLKYITIGLFVLFLITKVQSCSRKMTYESKLNNIEAICDSSNSDKIKTINSLEDQLDAQSDVIKELQFELKIAGVKAEEAQKRANAVLSTAEKIRSNTTIQIKGAEKDTSNIKN